MLTISRELADKIIAHARADHPDEACGVIAGPAGSDRPERFIAMDNRHGGLRERLVDANGLRRFVNVYLNDEDVRFIDGIDTKLSDGDTVTILPAVAGGMA